MEAFERTTDRKSKGVATLHFPERELFPTQGSHGYYYCDLGGRYYNEKWTLHRLVAAVWLPKPHDGLEINHIDGNKGNNSVENLEWITHQENEIHKHATGLVDDNKLSTRYKKYKNLIKIPPYKRLEITNKHKSGVSQKTLAKEYGCSQSCISATINEYTTSELSELFGICWMWEKTIEKLNHLRDLYVETNDYQYFRAMRALMPQGYLYKSTVTMNYENLYNMIHQRKDHKLNEWSGKDDPTKPNFVKWCASLPYAKEFLFLGIEQDYEHFQDIIST